MEVIIVVAVVAVAVAVVAVAVVVVVVVVVVVAVVAVVAVVTVACPPVWLCAASQFNGMFWMTCHAVHPVRHGSRWVLKEQGSTNR